jgi:CRISPR-associated protein Csb3
VSDREPNIIVNVDVTNPGQFFACCGLLELASRIDPYAVGGFDRGHFAVSGEGVASVLDRLFECKVDTEAVGDQSAESDDDHRNVNQVDSHRGRIYPMKLGRPFNLRLDWWNDRQAQDQKLKTWTAGQRVTDLFLGYHKRGKQKGEVVLKPIPSMRDHFRRAVKQSPDDWLRAALPIEVPMAFSYDSRLSRNNALDLGHVGDSRMAFSPGVDVLTLIGLQRFRPLTIETWSRNRFCTWHRPLPVQIAPVAALGLIPQFILGCFEFPIKARDAQGRYKLFGHAQPVRRTYV